MSKKSITTEEPKAVPVYVPILNKSILAVDQEDVEKQVKAALAQEEKDDNN